MPAVPNTRRQFCLVIFCEAGSARENSFEPLFVQVICMIILVAVIRHSLVRESSILCFLVS